MPVASKPPLKATSHIPTTPFLYYMTESVLGLLPHSCSPVQGREQTINKARPQERKMFVEYYTPYSHFCFFFKGMEAKTWDVNVVSGYQQEE